MYFKMHKIYNTIRMHETGCKFKKIHREKFIPI